MEIKFELTQKIPALSIKILRLNSIGKNIWNSTHKAFGITPEKTFHQFWKVLVQNDNKKQVETSNQLKVDKVKDEESKQNPNKNLEHSHIEEEKHSPNRHLQEPENKDLKKGIEMRATFAARRNKYNQSCDPKRMITEDKLRLKTYTSSIKIVNFSSCSPSNSNKGKDSMKGVHGSNSK